MKTISGQCVSVKDVSLSKAAKILSKFVSADNEHKRHRRETGTDSGMVVENSIDINKELSLGFVKSIELTRRQIHNGNAGLDDEKSTQTITKCSQELNSSIGYQIEHAGESEMYKKKKEKREVGYLQNGDSVVKFGDRKDDSKSYLMGHKMKLGQAKHGVMKAISTPGWKREGNRKVQRGTRQVIRMGLRMEMEQNNRKR
ncbi:unnamed protein product [Sphenostylis stenocarpa]|uniref:Uncharacterized protein n=1 Tax=Sphenostylis stenocarpa TaxID=92480 RepID=A0AA86T2D2_9FABA|nr:unnamed protein product [Sphenostylis stenocarpa]